MIWNEELDNKMISLYKTKQASEIAEIMSIKKHIITNRLHKLGVKKRDDYWSEEELELAKAGIKPEERSQQGYDVVRSRLGFTVRNKVRWEPYEDKFLLLNYKYLTNKELAIKLNRTYISVKSRKSILGCDTNRWTDIEIDILQSCSCLSECIERLPNRTEYSIKHMVNRLGMKFEHNIHFSLPHQQVCRILNRMSLIYVIEKRIGNYNIDCYLPSLKLCIEVDGTYWHRDNSVDKEKDKFLTAEGYKIIRIPEKKISDKQYVINIIKKHVVNCWEAYVQEDKVTSSQAK